jgi:hypothetical protein
MRYEEKNKKEADESGCEAYIKGIDTFGSAQIIFKRQMVIRDENLFNNYSMKVEVIKKDVI